jgi:hydroxyacylglutathione hydrolase
VAAGTVEVHQFPCLTDNYGYLVRDPATGTVASIDSPDADAILRELGVHGWQLDYILNTHHHGDHAGGNLALKAATGCRIVAARADAERIPGADLLLDDGDTFNLGSATATLIATPGHTRAHVCWWFSDGGVVFVGDTLFAMGCGRLFEGSPPQMWQSLGRLMQLPDDTRVYCAHEYTLKNGQFALTVEPGNTALQLRVAEVAAARAAGQPTVPTTIGAERATNPFVRADSPGIRAALGMPDAPDIEVFAETRRRKDRF